MITLAVLDGVLITLLVGAIGVMLFQRKVMSTLYATGRATGHAEGYQEAIADIAKGADLAQQDASHDGAGPVRVPGPDS